MMGRKMIFNCRHCNIERNESFVGAYCRTCFNLRQRKGSKVTECKKCQYIKRPEDKFTGRLCAKCYSDYQRNYRHGRKNSWIMDDENYVPYEADRLSNDECIKWIDETIAAKGLVDLFGLNKLITVYYSIGGSDQNDSLCQLSTKKQLQGMWKMCLDFHKKVSFGI